LPLVLYQGTGVWDAPEQFKGLLGVVPKALSPYVPDFAFKLFDLSQYSDEQIKGGVMARVMLLTMKYALRDELPEKLPSIITLLSDLADQPKGLKCLQLLYRYLVQATDKLSREDFHQALAHIPQGDKIMPTLAEQWFQEGMEKGLLQGKLEGKQEGELEGRLSEAWEALVDFYEVQFGLPSPSLVEKLHKIRNHEFLRLLRRQIKHCRDAAEFERLVDKATA
jgi:predicted transposase YdaD